MSFIPSNKVANDMNTWNPDRITQNDRCSFKNYELPSYIKTQSTAMTATPHPISE